VALQQAGDEIRRHRHQRGGKADDDCVVAGQGEVDQDDLEDESRTERDIRDSPCPRCS
jgi:hypothetical protein